MKDDTSPFVYLPMDCPVCGRRRVEWNGHILRCEKCTTSSEWDGFSAARYVDVERLGEACWKAIIKATPGDHPAAIGQRAAVEYVRLSREGTNR